MMVHLSLITQVADKMQMNEAQRESENIHIEQVKCRGLAKTKVEGQTIVS